MFHWPENAEALIARVQAGDSILREQLIADRVPEIRHLVRRITRSWLADHEKARVTVGSPGPLYPVGDDE
jgi:hypothetical protein